MAQYYKTAVLLQFIVLGLTQSVPVAPFGESLRVSDLNIPGGVSLVRPVGEMIYSERAVTDPEEADGDDEYVAPIKPFLAQEFDVLAGANSGKRLSILFPVIQRGVAVDKLSEGTYLLVQNPAVKGVLTIIDSLDEAPGKRPFFITRSKAGNEGIAMSVLRVNAEKMAPGANQKEQFLNTLVGGLPGLSVADTARAMSFLGSLQFYSDSDRRDVAYEPWKQADIKKLSPSLTKVAEAAPAAQRATIASLLTFWQTPGSVSMLANSLYHLREEDPKVFDGLAEDLILRDNHAWAKGADRAVLSANSMVELLATARSPVVRKYAAKHIEARPNDEQLRRIYASVADVQDSAGVLPNLELFRKLAQWTGRPDLAPKWEQVPGRGGKPTTVLGDCSDLLVFLRSRLG